MKILVTGAHGFIGGALCAFLETRGHCVVRAVRQARSAGEVAVGEVDAGTDWHVALEDCEAVAHLAARTHVMREMARDPLAEFRQVNCEGTLNLARQAAQAGARRFVYLSTIKVNGERTGEKPFSEEDAPMPGDAYAISKHEAEQGLRALARETNMEYVIIRPPLVYGPGVKANFARLMRWARRGIPLPLGAVRNRRSLVALDNLVSFIALCAERDESPRAANQLFLIGDDEDVSTTELLRQAIRASGGKTLLLPVPPSWLRVAARLLGRTETASRLLDSLVIDSRKARHLLGWRAVTSLEETLRKMARRDCP
ncbi:MAG: SDR family oxidoreductase [Zoogloeaceae bacterium]|jgi:nucleoside-diphosphate-sugar epimerase|nr:SDR family oxidoreductase [Zoogloeaceae bacterium]